MARTAKQILKARGWTDEEINDPLMTPMFANPKFVGALEAEDTEQERLRTMVDETNTWYETKAKPALAQATNDAVAAKAEAAKYRATLEAEQAYGLRRVANQDDPAELARIAAEEKAKKREIANTNFDETKYVSNETFQQVTDRFGEAIATATDLADDHRDLFGVRLPGGVGALRKEYQETLKQNRFAGSLNQFWESKYNVTAKRTELAEADRKKHEDSIRLDERNKVASEYANPGTRPLSLSRNPFTAKPVQGGSRDGAQPWDRTDRQRSSERVVKHTTKVLQTA